MAFTLPGIGAVRVVQLSQATVWLLGDAAVRAKRIPYHTMSRVHVCAGVVLWAPPPGCVTA